MKTRALLVPLVLTACGGGTGTLSVNTYGEDFIEEMIPPAAGPEDEGLVDGYTVRYTRFLLAISDIRVANRDGVVGAEMTEQRIFDLTKAGPHPIVTFADIGADHWDHVSVRTRPASAATSGNAEDGDVTRMNDNGWTAHVEGTAEDDTGRIDFAWSFTTDTSYEECVDADGFSGVTVPTGGSIDMQLTVHGDHFFYDDLQSPDASLRFAAFAAADGDGDGVVTLQEVQAVDLTTLPADQYGTGGDPDVNDLGAYVEALSRTLIHFQGEGDCQQIKKGG